MHHITVLPLKQNIDVAAGSNLLDVLRRAGFAVNAPCGGNGTCGKCKVLADGKEVLACQVTVDRDLTVELPQAQAGVILTDGIAAELSAGGTCLAIDIGTTTLAAYLIENGAVLAVESRKNPQCAFGSDVVSRIQAACKGKAAELTATIRNCVEDITNVLLAKTGKCRLDTVCIVGNPAMQQLFLGLGAENLAKPPFDPVLKKAEIKDGGSYIPVWEGADLLLVPNIAGYIGADTAACILATQMHRSEKLTLLVDIGTNGEMVLGNKDRLIACATAAGPALEGAGITFGMPAQAGAIDRVAPDLSCHVIGETKAAGICGSGLLDVVAVALHKGLINQRGRILNATHTLSLTDDIFLTQEDIRQFQQAKGAIAAGIRLLAKEMGVSLRDIETVYLAGAFGTCSDPHCVCRTGLLPPELEDKITSVGNAAGSGAKLMACDRALFDASDAIVSAVEHLDLAGLPDWAKCFARSMRFDSEIDYWCERARSLGFSYAVSMDASKLTAREDVRAMCAEDKCRAYGKNHTCPPYCGTLEECQAKMHRFSRGLLLQTVGTTKKAIDTKAYRLTEQRHLQQFYTLAEKIKAQHPSALCLGSGGCRICKKCAYPEPCPFPEKACSSMEGYGLFVTDVCRDNGLSYHHGEKTVTYTACILF